LQIEGDVWFLVSICKSAQNFEEPIIYNHIVVQLSYYLLPKLVLCLLEVSLATNAATANDTTSPTEEAEIEAQVLPIGTFFVSHLLCTVASYPYQFWGAVPP